MGLPILSICPDSGNEFAALSSNSTLYPREKVCQKSTNLTLFGLHLQVTRVLALFRSNNVVPVVLMHTQSVHVDVLKICQSTILFSKVKTSIHFYLRCQFRRLISDCRREEKDITSILDSCSQEAPLVVGDGIQKWLVLLSRFFLIDLIVSDSQLRKVGAKRMPNDHHFVEKKFKPGMKIQEAIHQAGKTNNNVIIVHASTNNVSKTAPQELCKEVVETLEEVQENYPRSKIAFRQRLRGVLHMN